MPDYLNDILHSRADWSVALTDGWLIHSAPDYLISHTTPHRGSGLIEEVQVPTDVRPSGVLLSCGWLPWEGRCPADWEAAVTASPDPLPTPQQVYLLQTRYESLLCDMAVSMKRWWTNDRRTQYKFLTPAAQASGVGEDPPRMSMGEYVRRGTYLGDDKLFAAWAKDVWPQLARIKAAMREAEARVREVLSLAGGGVVTVNGGQTQWPAELPATLIPRTRALSYTTGWLTLHFDGFRVCLPWSGTVEDTSLEEVRRTNRGC